MNEIFQYLNTKNILHDGQPVNLYIQKIYSQHLYMTHKDEITVGTLADLLNFGYYTLDKVSFSVILNGSSETVLDDIIIYSFYEIDGYIYRTCLGEDFSCENSKFATITFSDYIDTSKKTDYTNCFKKCSATSIDFMKSTYYVYNAKGMFEGCSNLTDINNLESLDTTNSISFTDMFRNCPTLIGLNIPFKTNKCIDVSCMFYDSTSLTYIKFNSSFASEGTIKSFNSMFQCTNVYSLDLSNFNFKSATDLAYMFDSCTSLYNIDFPVNADCRNVEDMESMFSCCEVLTNINSPDEEILNISFITSSKLKNLFTFMSYVGCTKIIINNFNTSGVTDFDSAFCNTYANAIDISCFDFSNATTINSIFSNNSLLTSLTLNKSNWDAITLDKTSAFTNTPNVKIIDSEE